MLIVIGTVVGLACVLGGYMAMGGKLGVLYQPFELVIIGGAAVGAFIVGNLALERNHFRCLMRAIGMRTFEREIDKSSDNSILPDRELARDQGPRTDGL